MNSQSQDHRNDLRATPPTYDRSRYLGPPVGFRAPYAAMVDPALAGQDVNDLHPRIPIPALALPQFPVNDSDSALNESDLSLAPTRFPLMSSDQYPSESGFAIQNPDFRAIPSNQYQRTPDTTQHYNYNNGYFQGVSYGNFEGQPILYHHHRMPQTSVSEPKDSPLVSTPPRRSTSAMGHFSSPTVAALSPGQTSSPLRQMHGFEPAYPRLQHAAQFRSSPLKQEYNHNSVFRYPQFFHRGKQPYVSPYKPLPGSSPLSNSPFTPTRASRHQETSFLSSSAPIPYEYSPGKWSNLSAYSLQSTPEQKPQSQYPTEAQCEAASQLHPFCCCGIQIRARPTKDFINQHPKISRLIYTLFAGPCPLHQNPEDKSFADQLVSADWMISVSRLVHKNKGPIQRSSAQYYIHGANSDYWAENQWLRITQEKDLEEYLFQILEKVDIDGYDLLRIGCPKHDIEYVVGVWGQRHLVYVEKQISEQMPVKKVKKGGARAQVTERRRMKNRSQRMNDSYGVEGGMGQSSMEQEMYGGYDLEGDLAGSRIKQELNDGYAVELPTMYQAKMHGQSYQNMGDSGGLNSPSPKMPSYSVAQQVAVQQDFHVRYQQPENPGGIADTDVGYGSDGTGRGVAGVDGIGGARYSIDEAGGGDHGGVVGYDVNGAGGGEARSAGLGGGDAFGSDNVFGGDANPLRR